MPSRWPAPPTDLKPSKVLEVVLGRPRGWEKKSEPLLSPRSLSERLVLLDFLSCTASPTRAGSRWDKRPLISVFRPSPAGKRRCTTVEAGFFSLTSGRHGALPALRSHPASRNSPS